MHFTAYHRDEFVVSHEKLGTLLDVLDDLPLDDGDVAVWQDGRLLQVRHADGRRTLLCQERGEANRDTTLARLLCTLPCGCKVLVPSAGTPKVRHCALHAEAPLLFAFLGQVLAAAAKVPAESIPEPLRSAIAEAGPALEAAAAA
jgi:hypothetical protein